MMKYVTLLLAVGLSLVVMGFNGTHKVEASILVVTSDSDSGPGTLRQALVVARNGDTITFDPIVFSLDNPATIELLSPLPELSQGEVTIDASNAGVILNGQALSSGQGLHVTSSGNAIKGLHILHFPDHGIRVDHGASNNIIGGKNATPNGGCSGDCNLISGNGADGLQISGLGADNNLVLGNYVGTDTNGESAIGNRNMGVSIVEGASHNKIGGAAKGEGNLISGNGEDGLFIHDSGTKYNIVLGNCVGTNASGAFAVPNGNVGINLGNGTQNNLIGGHTAAERNIISGNRNFGVHIGGNEVMYNLVIGNYIGTDSTGSRAIGNRTNGVAFGASAQNNRVGGETPSERNIISGNRNGVRIDYPGTMNNTISGNYIGTDATGTKALGNDEFGVIIYGGAGPNIIGPGNIIAYNGVSGVGVNDPDTLGNTLTSNAIYDNGEKGVNNWDGGNAELAPPMITYVDTRVIRGTASVNSTVEVFSDEVDQGRVFEGKTNADNEGNFEFLMPVGTFTGPNVTTTATDAPGNTSEFSLPESLPTPIITRELPNIVSPMQVSVEPKVVGTNLGLALFSVLFFGFTSSFFNSIVEDYRDEIIGTFGNIVPRPIVYSINRISLLFRRASRWTWHRFLFMWFIVILITAIIESFLDPDIGIVSSERVGIIITLFISAIVVSALVLSSDLLARRHLAPNTKAETKVQWIGIAIAVACVLLSRALDFKPGYIYGIVGAIYLTPKLIDTISSGKRAVFVLMTIFVGGLLVWIASAFLPDSLTELEPVFLTIFLLCLQVAFFELFPLAVTEGCDIWSWRRGVWFVIFFAVFFCFYHFLLNPNASEVQALQQNGVQTLIILIAVFGLATFTLWLLFPFRLQRKSVGDSS